jgi:hypothetical protein
MRYLVFLLLTNALSGQSCQWLNSATAAGVLGGPVQLKASAAACEFVREQPGARYRLYIEVQRITASNAFESYLSHCGRHRTPLTGIGNEAFACEDDRSVVGRVRNQMFAVRLVAPRHSVAPDKLEEGVRKVAEQVAGMLF